MVWEKIFAPQILDRGYDYYFDDAVTDLEVFSDFLKESVLGTEKYNVKISLLR